MENSNKKNIREIDKRINEFKVFNKPNDFVHQERESARKVAHTSQDACPLWSNHMRKFQTLQSKYLRNVKDEPIITAARGLLMWKSEI